MDLIVSAFNDIISIKIYENRENFNFDSVNFPCVGGDVPPATYYGVYIYHLIRFTRANSQVGV